jgi:hypothetical protein
MVTFNNFRGLTMTVVVPILHRLQFTNGGGCALKHICNVLEF